MAWQSIIGITVFTGFAWALSEDRRAVTWRLPAAGLGVQFALALVLLKLPATQDLFLAANAAVGALQAATREGTMFVFGYLGGGAPPFAASQAGSTFILAFQALPLILVVSALSALLFHWRILPLLVRGFAWALEKSLGVGGSVGVATAANVFVGMVEAPLLVRPYLKQLSRSELFIVMTAGMATIAGTVLVLYATILDGIVPNAVGHVLTASLLNAPAAVMVARLMVPGDEKTAGGLDRMEPAAGAMEAVTRGTMDGVKLLINVVAMLVVMVALVALVNTAIGVLPDVAGAPLTLQRMLGWAMAPVVWLMGVPWADAVTAGGLMGVKVVLNEFLAYLQMAGLEAGALTDRSRTIMTYALCSFANFGSLGIMIGGLVTMVPERRADVVSLGGRTIVSGTLATCLTGAMAGLLL